MVVNGIRISEKKFWSNFKAPEIENLEDLYEDYADNFMMNEHYTEDAWCYLQDYEDGILIRSFLLRRNLKKKKVRKQDKYIDIWGDLTCNREVMRTFISKSGVITRYMLGAYNKFMYGYVFTNEGSGYYKVISQNCGIDVCCDKLIVDDKCQNIKYVLNVIANHCNTQLQKDYSGKDSVCFRVSELTEIIKRYLDEPRYEILYKNGYFNKIDCIDKLSNKEMLFLVKNNLAICGEAESYLHTYDLKILKKVVNTFCFKEVFGILKEYVTEQEVLNFAMKCAKTKLFIVSHYRDYLLNLRTLNIEFNNKTIFNKNFEKEHERMTQRIIIAKNEKTENAFKEFMSNNRKIFDKMKMSKEYTITFPESLLDFAREGETLSHCVFKCQYYRKMLDGDCIIAFIRKNDAVDTPFVTVEFDTSKDNPCRVLQCYAEHDTRPSQDVIDFVDRASEYYAKTNIIDGLKGVELDV